MWCTCHGTTVYVSNCFIVSYMFYMHVTPCYYIRCSHVITWHALCNSMMQEISILLIYNFSRQPGKTERLTDPFPKVIFFLKQFHRPSSSVSYLLFRRLSSLWRKFCWKRCCFFLSKRLRSSSCFFRCCKTFLRCAWRFRVALSNQKRHLTKSFFTHAMILAVLGLRFVAPLPQPICRTCAGWYLLLSCMAICWFSQIRRCLWRAPSFAWYNAWIFWMILVLSNPTAVQVWITAFWKRSQVSERWTGSKDQKMFPLPIFPCKQRKGSK